MRLLITDPIAVVADLTDVVSVRAEDESGSFGILRGHADFLTTLALSVVSWRHEDGRRGYCAVRRGVFSVLGGEEVLIATREAHLGEDPAALEAQVLAGYHSERDAERRAGASAAQLRMRAIRQIVQALRGGGGGTELSV
ncbi:MAG: F0F1 ATP synthase subunit epsilon [Pseudomonadales bacterium]|jgi:F-type H+-transporting ATPase subunit epsilon|nr:F0F1 ATP synthase subunit epsilon [Pseudomonadales bacterium]